MISGHQEFSFLAIWSAGYFFPFFPINFLLHLCCMQFFSSDKRLQEIIFQNHPPPPPQELNGRPLLIATRITFPYLFRLFVNLLS